jgi:hypothetical protein
MSALKLRTLEQKLWAIVGTSFIARVIMFFILPSTPSILAPDEGTYAFLAKWITESKPATDFPGFGERLYLSGRSIILPASMFIKFGVNELDAVRLVSSIYGLGTLILVVFVVTRIFNQSKLGGSSKGTNEKLILSTVFVFAFLPSHFLWSNLGLRESATEFWVILSFVAFYFFFSPQKRQSVKGVIFFVGCLVLTFSARPQVGWVLAISLIIFSLCHLKQARTFFVVLVLVFSTLLGGTLVVGAVESPATEVDRFKQLIAPLLNAGTTITTKQEINQVDAASAIETQGCPRESTTLASSSKQTNFDTYFCIAWRAPYMVSTFLFRPILGADVTSTSGLFAAIENIFWLVAFVTIIILGIRRRAVSFFVPILPTFIFFVLYVVGASAYQGNMGTGFRHKSLTLWIVLLLLFALAWKKTDSPEQNPRNNSQESAV